LLSYWLSLVY
jgi:hypothetical protein